MRPEGADHQLRKDPFRELSVDLVLKLPRITIPIGRTFTMLKYLFQASYTAEGAKGLLKDGGSKRVRAAKTAAKAVGGKVDALYFAFGGMPH